jgi:peptide/nickel transport system substrate-binding protein
MGTPTRRRVIKQSALASTGTTVFLAGCGNSDDRDGGGGNGGQGQGDVVELELMTSPQSATPTQFEAVNLLAEEMRSLGVQVEFNTLSIQKIVEEAVKKKNFQALGLSYSGLIERLVDPDAALTLWLHSEGSQNMSIYEKEEYDAAVEAQRRLYDIDERRKKVDEAQAIAHEDVPVIVHSTRDILAPYRSDRFSNPVTMPGIGLDSVQNHTTIQPADDVSRLRLVRFGSMGNFNPLFGIATDHRIYRLLYDTLMAVNPESLEPEPWAAESIEASDDTTVDVTLRSGMSWHDGEPVTPEDVKFSFEFMAHSPDFKSRVQQIDTVEVTGEHDVRFNLKEPYAPLITLTFVTVYLLPKHVWKDVDAETATDWPNDDPVGSGPFQFDVWRKQEEVALTRYEAHFQAANVENVSYVPVPDAQNAIRFLESGQADTTAAQAEIPPTTAERFTENPDITVEEVPDHGPHHLTFQTQRKPGNDKAFREAVAWAVPRKDIVETIFGGYGNVEKDSFLTTPIKAWHNDDLEQRSYDPEKARQILSDADYTWDDQDRLRYPADG